MWGLGWGVESGEWTGLKFWMSAVMWRVRWEKDWTKTMHL